MIEINLIVTAYLDGLNENRVSIAIKDKDIYDILEPYKGKIYTNDILKREVFFRHDTYPEYVYPDDVRLTVHGDNNLRNKILKLKLSI